MAIFVEIAIKGHILRSVPNRSALIICACVESILRKDPTLQHTFLDHEIVAFVSSYQDESVVINLQSFLCSVPLKISLHNWYIFCTSVFMHIDVFNDVVFVTFSFHCSLPYIDKYGLSVFQ